MGYGSGRFPVERASKIGHVKLVEHEQVARLVRQFERIDTTGEKPVGECTGHLDMDASSKIRFVVTVDGGQAVVPNEIRRDKRVAFVSICAMLIRREDIRYLRDNPVVDPREMLRMFEDSLWYQGAVLPLAGVRLPGETVKDTIRASVDAALEYTKLYDVLNFLVSRLWEPSYDMNPRTNSQAPHIDCRSCGAVLWIPRDRFNFSCQDCGFAHRLSDYLGIGEEAPENWAREEAAMSLRNALETLTLFHFVVHLWRTKPKALNETLFLKDGPLLLRAQLSRLVEPIRAFITFLTSHGQQFYMVGVEKNGDLVDHLEDIKKHLSKAGDYFLPSVQYLLEEVAGIEYDPLRYRNRVQYGAKVAIRLGPDHVIPMDVPTGLFLTEPKPENLIGFPETASVLAEMTSYSHDNALIPLKLCNDFSSISEHPSGDILKAFAGNLLNKY